MTDEGYDHEERPRKRPRRDARSPEDTHRKHRRERSPERSSHEHRNGKDHDTGHRSRSENRDSDRKHHHRRNSSHDSDQDEKRRGHHHNGRKREKSRERTRQRSRSRSREHRRYRSKERDSRKEKRSRGQRSSVRSRSRSNSRAESPSISRSRSPIPKSHHRDKKHQRSTAPLPSQNAAFSDNNNQQALTRRDGKSAISSTTNTTDPTTPAKQKPNFQTTGKLAMSSNTIQTGNRSIVLKYHEPPESRKPAAHDTWRLYVFKDADILETIELHTQSCWLFGRESSIVDVALEHPSCSKQHAVLQFRYVTDKKNARASEVEFGDDGLMVDKRHGGGGGGRVKPYVIDLESSNGTTVNDMPAPPATFVELRDGDVLKFGAGSSREYVLQLPPPATKKTGSK